MYLGTNKPKIKRKLPKQQYIYVLLTKFQIIYPPKLVETVSVEQHHEFTFTIYLWIIYI